MLNYVRAELCPLLFLKERKKQDNSYCDVRITVDNIPKEASTRRQWDQKEGKTVGTKKDTKTLNAVLESLTTKINSYKTELFNKVIPVSSVDLINFVKGRSIKRNKVLEEFFEPNEEIKVLVKKKEYSKGTHTRYVTARSHVKDFIKHKFQRDDIEFTA
ncbi:site-specific recombinase XerD [Chryseobacterium sp. StRB126]|uniref:hypothetical protein n=1 Tax=Chryseobacterium sp. StRB126 TaxID=878220 RepID=UPI0004E99781